MGLFFKKSKKDALADSRARVEDNARILKVCAELAPKELSERIARIADDVKYMTPSAVDAVTACDKKIYALAGDLKIAVSKDGARALSAAEEPIKELERVIAERKAYR